MALLLRGGVEGHRRLERPHGARVGGADGTQRVLEEAAHHVEPILRNVKAGAPHALAHLVQRHIVRFTHGSVLLAQHVVYAFQRSSAFCERSRPMPGRSGTRTAPSWTTSGSVYSSCHQSMCSRMSAFGAAA